MRKITPTRIIVYTKDVALITGRTERTSRKLLTRVRKHYRKDSRSLVTVEEFCAYTGFDPDVVMAALQ
jgi:hypothetical protein